MAKGLFYGGSGRRAVAHTDLAFPKMPTPRRHSTDQGRLRRRAMNPPSPKGVKARGEDPEAEGNYPAAKTHSARSVPAASTASRNATQQLEKRSVNAPAAAVFVDLPTQRASMAQGLFYGGSGRRAVAHTRPAFPKMPTSRRHSPD